MAFNPQSTKRQELSGVFRSQRFFNPDSRFMIGSLESGESILGCIGERELIPGIEYLFLGRWEGKEGEGYGKQFKFDTFIQSEPHSRRGVVEYLKKIAPGVGDITAHKLCDLFGENECLEMLKRNPKQVAELVPTLRNGKAELAAQALIKEEKFQETRIDLMDLFAGRGFPGSLIDECISQWGIMAAIRVKKDPFCLLTSEMPGCGFLRVDRLYLELGNPPDRITRRVACAWHAVREDRTGSVWVKFETVLDGIKKLITNCSNPEVAIEIAVAGGWLASECFAGDVYLAESSQAEYEKNISERLAVLA